MLYMCIGHHIYVNMYHVSAKGVDERMINVHYYYYYYYVNSTAHFPQLSCNIPNPLTTMVPFENDQ